MEKINQDIYVVGGSKNTSAIVQFGSKKKGLGKGVVHTFIGTLTLINGDKIEGQFIEYSEYYMELNSSTEYFKNNVISVKK